MVFMRRITIGSNRQSSAVMLLAQTDEFEKAYSIHDNAGAKNGISEKGMNRFIGGIAVTTLFHPRCDFELH